MSEIKDSRIIVALDFANEHEALALVDRLDPNKCKLKVGKEMFTHFGPTFVKKLIGMDFKVFLDMKFHDIPNTVARAVAAAADLGVWMVNVHASGSYKMMEAAAKSLEEYGADKPKLIAVTVLTSMDQEQLSAIGITCSIEEQVLRLANLTKQSGLDGVVCSARESSLLRNNLGKDFLLVTPGIRPSNSEVGDQVRIVTPQDAVNNGSDYLVIGRPITKANNPLNALDEIIASIDNPYR